MADERDVIRLRTNYRRDPPEDVYIYRAKAPIEVRRRLFLEYMHRISALRTQPEFYNTLTTNCTTNIWTNNHVNAGRVQIFPSGHCCIGSGVREASARRIVSVRCGAASATAQDRAQGVGVSLDQEIVEANASCSFAVLSPSTLHFSIRGWM